MYFDITLIDNDFYELFYFNFYILMYFHFFTPQQTKFP